MRIFLYVVAAAVVVFLAFGIYGSTRPDSAARSHERAKIDLCWDNHAKKSLAEDEKRFIAGVCERMESEFKTRFGVSP